MKHYNVDPQKLSEVFNNVTATYKYYWFLALLDSIRAGKARKPISFNEMVARMMSRAWLPVTTHTFSFGKCDSLMQRINQLIFGSELKVNDMEQRVFIYIMKNADMPIVKELVDKMTKYVPYRFLYPWLGADLTNSATALASQQFDKYNCPYAIKNKHVIINPDWVEYFKDHIDILQDFTTYNLLVFLKKYNDNVLLPEEEYLSTTADGYTTSINTSMGLGMVCDPPATEQDKRIRQLEKQLKERDRQISQFVDTYSQLLQKGSGATYNIDEVVIHKSVDKQAVVGNGGVGFETKGV